MNTEKQNSNEPQKPQFNIPAVRRSFSYEEAKKIYIEGLGIGQLVERGGLPNAEKFEEMLYRMNLVR
jgi:hypothetical protein